MSALLGSLSFNGEKENIMPLLFWKISSKEHKTVVSVLSLDGLTGLLNNPDNCKELAFNWSQALEKKQYIMYVSANNNSLKLYAEILNETLSIILIENDSPRTNTEP